MKNTIIYHYHGDIKAVLFSRWVHKGLCASLGPSEEEEREFVSLKSVIVNTPEACLFSRWVRNGLCASFGPSEEEEREFVLLKSVINTPETCLLSAGPKDLALT